jgi:hypothetical protein
MYIAISESGKITIHLPDVSGNYATLCGMDGNDNHRQVQQTTVPVPRGAKVNCRNCFAIWELSRRYSRIEFEI